MQVSSVGSSTPAANIQTPQTDAQKAGLNYDAFLKLLLAQLKSQDPTNPVDQTESLAQLASFTNVEQTIKLNEKLDSLLSQNKLSDGAALIGRSVTSLADNTSGKVSSVEFKPDGLYAILEDGKSLAVSDGLRIS